MLSSRLLSLGLLHYLLSCVGSLYRAAFMPGLAIVKALLSISIVHRLDIFLLSSFVSVLQLLGFSSRLIAPFVATLFQEIYSLRSIRLPLTKGR